MKPIKSNFLSTMLAAGGLALTTPLVLNADTLVDSFDNSNPASVGDRPWGGTATWRNILNGTAGGNDNWKSGTAGKGNKIRSISDTTPGNNDTYDTAIVSGSMRYNHDTAADGGGITASGALTASKAFQQLGFQIIRETADFDATSSNYFRVTAWLDDASTAAPTPNPLKSSANMIISFGQEPGAGTLFGVIPLNQPAKFAMGPYNSGTGTLEGLSVTSAPQVFILDIKDTNIFKVDDDFEAFQVDTWNSNSGAPVLSAGDLALDDWSDIRTIQFASLVQGAAAQTGSFRVSFAIDDAMFLDNLPGLSFSADPLALTEGGSDSVDVVLDALPSHDVTFDFPDNSLFEFSPNQLIFTTSNWDTPQPLTVTAIDTGTIEGTSNEAYDPGVSTSDLWYGNETLDSLNVALTENNAGDLIINEIMADPTGFDSNGDSTLDVIEDEYVELYNTTGGSLDISGWTISDGSGLQYTFPASTIIPADGTVVIFGGGTPTGIPGDFVDTAGGSLSLNNTGDTVTVENEVSQLVDTVTYGSEGNNDESLTRDPDISGGFVGHTTATGSGGSQGSPGTKINGSALPVELDQFIVD